MKKNILICLVIVVALAFAGCGGANIGDNDLNDTPDLNGYDNNGYNNGYDNNNANNVGYPNNNSYTGVNPMGYGTRPINYGNRGNNMANTNNQALARDVSRKIENMENVDDCSIVLDGNTCLVGLDISERAKGYRKEDIRNKVRANVKAMCPGVTDITVTESPDLFKRIKNLSDDMANGRTMDNLGDEIRDIVRNNVR